SSKADYRLMASLYLTGFSPATCRDLAQSLEPSPLSHFPKKRRAAPAIAGAARFCFSLYLL
ncbi:MAG: hypothetical protein ACYCX4_17800, partial [Bacillota bacterium]